MPVPRDMDLDLLFTRSGSHYRAQVVQSPAGDGQQATFERPFTDLELENIILKLGRFRHRTRRYEAAPVAVAKQAGGRLFEAVFAGTVGDCLRRSRDRAEAAQATLRIRLRLSDCPELADLPWELLYDQSDDWFLGLFGNTPVIRYIQPPVHPRSVQVALPLHILVIRSEPSGLPPLNLKSEWEHVAEALSELIDDGLLVVTELVAPTLSELRRAFLRDTFHVLHYIGRGAFDQDRGGILFLTDQAGQAVSITGEDLGVILHDHASMRLAVLNSCEGGRTDPQDPFAGVADKLIRRGIPAVVATQFEISDQAAAEFAPAFYGELAAGRSVDAAAAEARMAIYSVSSLEWATPVLHLRADDGRLFGISQDRTSAINVNPDSAAETRAADQRPHSDEKLSSAFHSATKDAGHRRGESPAGRGAPAEQQRPFTDRNSPPISRPETSPAEDVKLDNSGFQQDVRSDLLHGDGDHDRFAHYVDKSKIVDSIVTETPLTALCGKVWVPSRSPKKYPICPICERLYDQLPPGGN